MLKILAKVAGVLSNLSKHGREEYIILKVEFWVRRIVWQIFVKAYNSLPNYGGKLKYLI